MLRDLKIAVRYLLKAPGFSAMAVLMLTLGIGATTAIFSIVEGVLLRPLPFPHAGELVAIADTIKGADIAGDNEAGVTAPDIVNYQDIESFLAGVFRRLARLSGYSELSGFHVRSDRKSVV